MGKNLTNFEQSIREGLSDYEVPFNESKWTELEQRMDGKSVSNGTTMAAAIVTALILLSGFTYVYLDNQTEPTAQIGGDVAVTESTTNSDNSSNINPTETNQINEQNNLTFDESDGSENEVKSEENKSTNQFKKNNSSDGEISNNNSDQLVNTSKNETNNGSSQSLEGALTAGAEELEQAEENSSEISVTESKSSAPSINVSMGEACSGEKILFTANNISDEASFLWNFGNGDFSTDVSPERSFSEPGEYNVSLILSNSSKKIESKIIIYPKPVAKFSYEQVKTGEMVFKNLSEKADNFSWEIDGETFSSDINPSLSYVESKRAHVRLIVENEYGCSSDEYRYVPLEMPAVDAPSGIKQGEKFEAKFSDEIEGEVVITVHNMNGQMIFESTNNNKYWDGSLPDGTYASPGEEFAWFVLVKNEDGAEIYQENGRVTIIP